ncbi:MAG: LarC family nickel insertion protein [Candidatus Undinarchaeales archaeon]|jgi:hypothetical protein|nr:LarC family nickel insertion protein [Candidatus Undinarchaeales archaeon]MDP7492332.1 LarC family nickel insertion protein [Candidatus Undinarchaeales archaeon]
MVVPPRVTSDRVAYVDISSGASGNMLLGALTDAGLDLVGWNEGMATLGVGGWGITVERRDSHGVEGTFLDVVVEGHDRPHRDLTDIEDIITASDLPVKVKARSIAVFRRLARAEARAHGTDIAAVRFHEVGAVDSIVDTVGFVLGLELLGVERLHASQLVVGSGTVRCAHGVLPVPAPATRNILDEAGVPYRRRPDAGTELLTPTGAALLAELATFSRPELAVESSGVGIGSRELPWPNVVRLELGRPASR